jgi:hypothetical protein
VRVELELGDLELKSRADEFILMSLPRSSTLPGLTFCKTRKRELEGKPGNYVC